MHKQYNPNINSSHQIFASFSLNLSKSPIIFSSVLILVISRLIYLLLLLIFAFPIQFQYQMNDQLNRIKQKDYSKLDEVLFQNLTRADQLTYTLGHLSEFQQFLMSQINSLNAPVQNKPSLAKSIVKNFDNLRESIARCSKARQKAQIDAITMLKREISKLKDELKTLKSTSEQIIYITRRECIHITESSLLQMKKSLLQERQKRIEVERKYEQLQRQHNQLKSKASLFSNQASTIRQKSVVYNENESVSEKELKNQISIIKPFKLNSKELERTPMRQVSINSLNNEKNKIGWKIEQPCKSITELTNQSNNKYSEQRSSSLKRQTSNHAISRKQALTIFQQSEAAVLLNKGVKRQERGKSKQKIKIFSMY